MVNMNVFRILGDVSHTASKCILIWAIHSNKSAEGVSLVTQILYFLVFITRYLDLFWIPPYYNWWNFTLKNAYIWSSLYIIFIMTRVFARTRERERAWKFAGYILGGSILAAPLVSILFRWGYYGFFETLWTFSIILESVCVLPQLLILRQTTVPTVIDSFYLVTLGSYRAFYILNWIIRAATGDKPDPVSIIFGIIQTAFYLDFAWVYWTRQRVKLRGGAVVDSDDLRKGYLVNRFTNHRPSTEDEVEAGDRHADPSNGRPNTNKWGARGVSIRADDTLEEHEGLMDQDEHSTSQSSEQAKAPLKDPDQFLSDEEDDAPVLDVADQEVFNSNQEWRNSSPDPK